MIDHPLVVPRLVCLGAVAAGYLTIFQSSSTAPLLDWGFGAAAVAIGLFGGIRPLPAAAAMAVLLAAADLFGTFERGPAALVKFFAVFALFELAVRRPPRSVAIGMTALSAVYAVHTAPDLPGDLPSLLYRIAITVALPALLGAYIRAVRTVAAQARQRAEQERARNEARLQTAAVAERTALARELHDLVAHHVSAMVLRVGVARHVAVGADPRLVEVLDDLHRSGTAALADLRRLVAVLRDPAQATRQVEVPVVEPDELAGALLGVAERYRDLGIAVEASIDSEVARLDPVRARTVLRLAQEGFANAAKHAGAACAVQFSVTVDEFGSVRLRLVDSGGPAAYGQAVVGPAACGQAVATATGTCTDTADSAGFGLIGMRERVSRLGGSLRAGPADGQARPAGRDVPAVGGWELAADLPAIAPAGNANGTGQEGHPA